MSLLFAPADVAGLTLSNRVILPPMCQYSVTAKDGVPCDWHRVHLGARAAGGFGLVVAEASAVSPEGRISDQDTGIWNDEQCEAWTPIVDFIHSQGARAAVQLAHAGAKASTWPNLPGYPSGFQPLAEGGWEVVSPSGIHPVSSKAPNRALTEEEIEELIAAFAAAARRAADAGFDAVQIHAAHGYLVHQFLSPVTNTRTDAWGGSFENRTRFLRRIVAAVSQVLPAETVLGVRFSGSDWLTGSWSIEDTVELARQLHAAGLQWVDLSSGGIGDTYQGPRGPGYQVPLAQAVKEAVPDLFVSAVGVITDPAQAETVLAEGRADAVCIGRASLVQPNWPVIAAHALDEERAAELPAPQYARARWDHT